MAVRKPRLKSTTRKAVERTKGALAKVPGPSNNPATNILIMDIAMRGASMIAGRAIEKALLRVRYSGGKASDIVKGRGMAKSLVSTAAARMATRSVPGFLLVSGGLVAKAIFDRSLTRRESVRRGEKAIAEQAAQADDE